MSGNKEYLTNVFDNSKFGIGNTIASNSRARIEKTDDGRIYVVIDGIKYSASKYDLFGMNDNPNDWLDAFVNEYDKESKKEEFNSPYKNQIADIDKKMAYNKQKAKEASNIQEKIKAAIRNTNIKLSSFLKECGVHLRSSLSGEKRQFADNLYKEFWANRFALVHQSNIEIDYYNRNRDLAFDKGKAEREITFNNIVLERTYGG